jgi:hypothetical protein
MTGEVKVPFPTLYDLLAAIAVDEGSLDLEISLNEAEIREISGIVSDLDDVVVRGYYLKVITRWLQQLTQEE